MNRKLFGTLAPLLAFCAFAVAPALARAETTTLASSEATALCVNPAGFEPGVLGVPDEAALYTAHAGPFPDTGAACEGGSGHAFARTAPGHAGAEGGPGNAAWPYSGKIPGADWVSTGPSGEDSFNSPPRYYIYSATFELCATQLEGTTVQGSMLADDAAGAFVNGVPIGHQPPNSHELGYPNENGAPTPFSYGIAQTPAALKVGVNTLQIVVLDEAPTLTGVDFAATVSTHHECREEEKETPAKATSAEEKAFPLLPATPEASVTLETANPKAGEKIKLTGAGSKAGTGKKILSYDWEFGEDGKETTSTGTNPEADVTLKAGLHKVGLKVVNSSGETATATLPVGVSAKAGEKGATELKGVPILCEKTTISEGDWEITAKCIEESSPGNYVIESPQLMLDGMMLVPRSGGEGVFAITTTTSYGSFSKSTVTDLTGPAVDVELWNTPEGTIVLGGRELKSEPIVLASSEEGRAPVAKKAGEEAEEKYLMYIGVGRKCNTSEENEEGANADDKAGANEVFGNEKGEQESSKDKKASCCPTGANVMCGELPGKFPVTGHIAVSLNKKKQAVFLVNVHLSIEKVIEATGQLSLKANPQSGSIELQQVEFEIKEAEFAGIFKLEDVKFTYFWPGDVAAGKEKENSWEAKGKISIGPEKEAGKFSVAISFRQGNFYSAALGLRAPKGAGIPVFPGIEINELEGKITTANPLSFGGKLGASIATALELTLSFQYAEASEGNEGYFKGAGELELESKKFALLEVLVGFEGYVQAKLEFNLKVPETNPNIEVAAGIGFWDETAHSIWQAEGNIAVKLKIAGFGAGVNGQIIVNRKDAGACGELEVWPWHGSGQVVYSFEKSEFVSEELFESKTCKEELKPYEEVPLTKRAGASAARTAAARRAAARGALEPVGWASDAGEPLARASDASESFTLPSGMQGEELRINSPSGTPVLTLTGPAGQTVATPVPPATVAAGKQYVSTVTPGDPDQVIVLLEHPQGGEWRIEQAAASAPLGTVEGARVEPAVSISARVHAHRTAPWTMSYKIAHLLAGTHVRFVERGADSAHVLATVSRSAGTVTFRPEEAPAHARTIFAYVIDAEGAVVHALTVGHLTAPTPVRGGRIPRLRIVRRGASSALISWGAAANAREYRIKVRGSDGRLQTFFRRAGARSVTVSNVLPFESFTVTVTALGGRDLLRGRPATAKLAAVRKAKHPQPRRSGKHGTSKRTGKRKG